MDIHSDILKRGKVLQAEAATVIVVAILDFPHADCKVKLVDAWQQGGRDFDAVPSFLSLEPKCYGRQTGARQGLH